MAGYITIPPFDANGVIREDGTFGGPATAHTPGHEAPGTTPNSTTSICWAMLEQVPDTEHFRQLVHIDYAAVVKELSLTHHCRLCNQDFTLWDTLGRHPCRTHPGYFDTSARVWSCCGRHRTDPRDEKHEFPDFIPGCTRADHEVTGYDPRCGLVPHQRQPIPLPVAAIMPHLTKRHIVAFRLNYRANPNLSPDMVRQLEENTLSNEVVFEIKAQTSMQHPEFLFGAHDMCNYTVDFGRIGGHVAIGSLV